MTQHYDQDCEGHSHKAECCEGHVEGDYYIFELWMIVTDVDLQCYLTGNQLVEDITFMIKN